MLSYVYFGTNDLDRAIGFYTATLGALGMRRVVTNDPAWDRVSAGWGMYEDDGLRELAFWIGKPFDQQPATVGNGSMVAFRARSWKEVDDFYTAALRSRRVARQARDRRRRPDVLGDDAQGVLAEGQGRRIYTFTTAQKRRVRTAVRRAACFRPLSCIRAVADVRDGADPSAVCDRYDRGVLVVRPRSHDARSIEVDTRSQHQLKYQ